MSEEGRRFTLDGLPYLAVVCEHVAERELLTTGGPLLRAASVLRAVAKGKIITRPDGDYLVVKLTHNEEYDQNVAVAVVESFNTESVPGEQSKQLGKLEGIQCVFILTGSIGRTLSWKKLRIRTLSGGVLL